MKRTAPPPLRFGWADYILYSVSALKRGGEVIPIIPLYLGRVGLGHRQHIPKGMFGFERAGAAQEAL